MQLFTIVKWKLDVDFASKILKKMKVFYKSSHY